MLSGEEDERRSTGKQRTTIQGGKTPCKREKKIPNGKRDTKREKKREGREDEVRESHSSSPSNHTTGRSKPY